MSPHSIFGFPLRVTGWSARTIQAAVFALVVLVSALAAGLVAAGSVTVADAQSPCNFATPFGPDPAPNWKQTFAAHPDGVEFWIHQEIASDDTLRNEVLAAFDTWESEHPTINFRYMGSTSTLPQPGGFTDGINVIGDDRGALGPGNLGRAAFGGFTNDLQFDIELNFDSPAGIGVASVANRVADLQSIVLHEMGHVLGLDHTNTADQVMLDTLTVGDQVHSLGTEDRDCFRQIFGSPGPEPTAVPAPTPEPPATPEPSVTVNGADRPVQVMHTTTCLAGNGRVDTNIVNTSPDSAIYRVEFAGLSPRQNNVLSGDWWRMPITGRADGRYEIKVRRGNTIVSSQTVTVSCDTSPARITSPEVQVVNACRAGLGYLLFQFANPTAVPKGYVIEFEGVANRSTGAAAHGGSVRAVTGRTDGTRNVIIRSGGAIIKTFTVTTNC